MEKKRSAILLAQGIALAFLLIAGAGFWFYMSMDPNLAKALDKNSRTLVIANGEWVPYQGASLTEGGPMSRIVTAAFERQGWTVEYVYLPWAQGLSMTERVKTDATMLYSYNDERGKKFYYSDPVLELDTVVFYNLNKPVRWERPEDLKGLTLGGVEKYDYGFVREEDGYRIRRSSDPANNHRRLAEGRLDGAMEEVLVGMKILREENLQHRISFHPTPVKRTNYHMIISKDHPRAAEILQVFNLGLARIKEDGTFTALLEYK
ncbi:polar amino acid transport system substrate-binding protein [Desulfobotulus alkaliphilus]|uniref:Polar amino acid transport system substrate-binding protein n=1 Tax=Desulfobotulus alkaliphilus TaxID=622671 RepID=A0A562RMN8_9BACT|nr:transporter substrate-binding domain-containing protein [Desulfobotulus alkaliphilus]TWI70321.1 polar amino acid transport system substrate-binding protein [Desulfobotulus alkaliphilus]